MHFGSFRLYALSRGDLRLARRLLPAMPFRSAAERRRAQRRQRRRTLRRRLLGWFRTAPVPD